MVVGGDSKIACSLRQKLSGNVKYAVRRPANEPNDATFQNYASVEFDNVDTVINCTGLVSGKETELRDVNVELATTLAAAARQSGVRQFLHISSFAVYGPANDINDATPTVPDSAYGRSKLNADLALLSLASSTFSVKIVRFPIIVGPQIDGKLSRLLNQWQKIRKFPVPHRPVQRSMIGLVTVSKVLADLIDNPVDGIIHAADCDLFEYRRAAATLNASDAAGISTIILPGWIFRGLSVIAPSLTRSLYESSVLEPSVNYVVQRKIHSDLYAGIQALFLNLRRNRK